MNELLTWIGQNIGGIITGLLSGSGLTIGYQEFTKERKVLRYWITSQRVENNVQDLELKYKTRTVDTLDSVRISIKNTGNCPLQKFEVQVSAEDGEVANASVAPPKGANYGLQFNQTVATAQADLLQVEEVFSIEVVIVNSKTRTVTVVSRTPSLKLEKASGAGP